MITSEIIGHGYYLPTEAWSNNEVIDKFGLDTSDEWIYQRTGIRSRRIASSDELTSDLGYNASVIALENSKLDIADIDLILLATTTPDNTFPATATKIANMLGDKRNIPAFDIQSVCSGFIYALNTADSFIKSGKYKTILVIGSEIYSRMLNWQDRSTAILFGDGAGAIVFRAKDSNVTNHIQDSVGILDINCFTDGSFYDKLYVTGGVASSKFCGTVSMQGSEVYKYAIILMLDSLNKLIEKNQINIKDIDKLIPHQANSRIISSIAKRAGITNDKVLITLEKHANISAASLPVSFSIGVETGQVQKGDLLMLTALGGGFSWGSCLLRY